MMINQSIIDYLGAAPYAGNFGTDIIALEPEIECVTKWQDIFTGNPLLRAWHGGVVSGVLEMTAMLAVINSTQSQDCALISIQTSYLRPAMGDKNLYSRANVVRRGKHIHTINAVGWQKSCAEPVAIASLAFATKS